MTLSVLSFSYYNNNSHTSSRGKLKKISILEQVERLTVQSRNIISSAFT